MVRVIIKVRFGLLVVNMIVNVLMLVLECGVVNLSKYFFLVDIYIFINGFYFLFKILLLML